MRVAIWAALLMFLTAMPAMASHFWVGPSSDSSCTHETLQEAIGDATDPAQALPDGQTRTIQMLQGTIAFASDIAIDDPPNDLLIRGGGFQCGSLSAHTDYDTTVLELIGPAQRMFTITNSTAQRRTVTLQRLTLKGQQGGSSSGGLIRASGLLSLRLLEAARLVSGHADEGGAIWIEGPDQGWAILETDVTYDMARRPKLAENQATRGGAVFLGFGARALFRQVILSDNVADEDGGAVYAQPQSGGIFFDASEFQELNRVAANVDNNRAGASLGSPSHRGGAIFVTGSRIESSLDGAHPTTRRPVRFEGNVADEGGAIYATGETVASRIDMDTSLFRSNIARDRGGALFLSGRVDAEFNSTRPTMTASGFHSHEFSFNEALYGAAGSSGGGVFYLDPGTSSASNNPTLSIHRAGFHGNEGGGNVIGTAQEGTRMAIYNSVFRFNSSPDIDIAYLFGADTEQPFEFMHNTVMTNIGVRGVTASAPLEVRMSGSIFWNPGNAVWFNSDPGATLRFDDCGLINSSQNVPDTSGIIVGEDPQLNNEFLPSSTSPVIDACSDAHLDWAGGADSDLTGQARGIPLGGPAATPVDIGARELMDQLFEDRFE